MGVDLPTPWTVISWCFPHCADVHWWLICSAIVQVYLWISHWKFRLKYCYFDQENWNQIKPTKTGKFTLNFWDESQFSATCCNYIIYVLIYWIHWHLEFLISAWGPAAVHGRNVVSPLSWRPYKMQHMYKRNPTINPILQSRNWDLLFPRLHVDERAVENPGCSRDCYSCNTSHSLSSLFINKSLQIFPCILLSIVRSSATSGTVAERIKGRASSHSVFP